MEAQEIFLGNGAVSLGLLEAGCQVFTSYPGTPSSEILPEFIRLSKAEGVKTYTEWSTNEKVALDTAVAAALAGKRVACCMKQVGLNVAADPLMSSAYMGVRGGLVIVSCDDPGPHSSQTEQDTRFMARFANLPVFDPSNPREAREMAVTAMEVSEEFHIPVILRPAIRVCHARQSLVRRALEPKENKASFERNPAKWTGLPRQRYVDHLELNQKLKAIGEKFSGLSRYNFHTLEPGRRYPLGIIAGGVPSAVIRDLLGEEVRTDIPFLKIGTPFPFPEGPASEFMEACERVLVLEETDTLMEYLLRDRVKVLGRLSGHVPGAGELGPDVISGVVNAVLKEYGIEALGGGGEVQGLPEGLDLPVRKPRLCAGCPHRPSFFAIRKASPKAIFTGDIGCYTLGINMGVVDTCLDMGASINMANGFYHSFEMDGTEQPIVATIGDSTFFHSGTAALINAVYNDSRFILVILDNITTAMTGMQPTPGLGIRADGSRGKSISLEKAVKGCGVEFLEVVDPYELTEMNGALKKAKGYVNAPEGGIAVIIARHPCVIDNRKEAVPRPRKVTVTEDCTECNFCLERFECPALVKDEELERTAIDRQLCVDCGVCLQICPKGAIVEVEEQAQG